MVMINQEMVGKTYTPYHVHTDLSTGVTNVDSVTKYKDYIARAKELGMKAFAFSEHGSVFEWLHKKEAIEEAGMKYIHAAEVYLTETYEEKIRDNYHCVLIAKNFDGFKEINKLISKSFLKEHYYYSPRILIDDVINTSENVIITSACLGGVFGKGTSSAKEKMLCFAIANKDRFFLEVQHHNIDKQKEYNKLLYQISKEYGIRLIAGTDTHSLDDKHARGRVILQKATDTFFSDEEGWDLTFKSYDELVEAYYKQNVLPEDVFMKAIENTNVMADMVEEFTLDRSTKYPKIYENSKEIFEQKVREACKNHKYIQQRYTQEEIDKFIKEELEVYEKTESIDFMLLENHKKEWETENGIQRGYGRGSVSGSMIAYALGITEMDSKKFGLNFFRFQNPDRVTNCDIDVDYSEKDREKVKTFILRDHMNLDNLRSCDIITFNTIALKGSIKYVGKALDYPIEITQALSNGVYLDEEGKETVAPEIRKAYPDIFEYVDIVKGTVISIGTHASGVVVSDLEIDEMFGTCSVKDSEYPVSMINMKELDALMYVKLDILGLDNIGVINETCRILGIDRLNPDNTDLNDENVWKSIREDTTLIFQWESESAQSYLKRFMSDKTIQKVKKRNEDFSYIKWFSFGNGLLRPACASYRDSVASGEFYQNGLKELDDFLAPTMGHVTMQEDIMQFLVRFCEYTQAESDTVRRGIAKKYGTEKFLPEIEERFTSHATDAYELKTDECSEIIKPFLQVILDASKYSFSWNHSDAYSCVGYICGYLRYYYPLEFITAAMNVFRSKVEKIGNIVKYSKKSNVELMPIRFRYSKSDYMFDKDNNTIYKGVFSVKSVNEQVSDDLYALRDMKFDNFMELITYCKMNFPIKFNQIEALIKLEYFKEFGEIPYLLTCLNVFKVYHKRSTLKKEEVRDLGISYDEIKKFCGKETAKQYSQVDMSCFMNLVVQKQYTHREVTIGEILSYQDKYLGYIDFADSKYSKFVLIEKVDTKFSPKLTAYTLSKGKRIPLKISKTQFRKNQVNEGDVVQILNWEKNVRRVKDSNGEWSAIPNEYDWWLTNYRIVDNIKKYDSKEEEV